MKHTRREFLLSSTAIGALLSGGAQARSIGHGSARPGGAVAGSSPFQPSTAGNLFPQQPVYSVLAGININVTGALNSSQQAVSLLSGTTTVSCSGAVTAGSMTIQYMLDETPLGPPLNGPPANYTWNTTGVSDGTHALWALVLDSTTDAACYFRGWPSIVVVINGDPALVAPDKVQTVPSVAGDRSTFGATSPRPDYLTYPGSPSLVTNTTYPTIWGQSVPPATADSRYMGANAALLRNVGIWWGEPGNEYRWPQYLWTPTFNTLQTGGVGNKGVFVSHFNAQAAGITLTEAAYELIARANPSDGARLDSLLTPWTEFQEIPDGSGFYGVEISGRIVKYLWDASVTTVFGFKRDKTVLSVDWSDATWPEDNINRTHVGTCTGFDDIAGAGDLAIDPDNPGIIYVAVTTADFIAAVNITGGTISGIPALTAVVYAGIPPVSGVNQTGYVDNSNPLLAKFSEPFGMAIVPMSGAHDPKGTLYVADTNNNAIRKILRVSPGVAGAVSTLVGGSLRTNPDFATYAANFSTYCPSSVTPYTNAYIMGPNKVAITSNGGLMVVELWNNTMRYINLAGNSVIISGTYLGDPPGPSGGGGPGSYRWIDCDYTGSGGPVDDWISLDVTGAYIYYWRGAADGSYSALFSATPNAYLRQGYIPNIQNTLGHYAWSITFARTQGRIITAGLANPNCMVSRIAFQAGFNGSTVTDPLAAADDNFVDGFSAWASGSCIHKDVSGGEPPLFPYGSRPSFVSVLGWGSCNLGAATYNSFDEINAHFVTDGNYNLHPGDPANAGTLTAYIQAGLGGAVPRPEFTGNNLRDFIYFIRRGSNAGSWPTIVAIGPTNPDVTAPVITITSAVRSGGSFTVTWNTDKPTFGILVAGSSAQQSLSPLPANNPYPIFAFESFTPGVASYKTTGHTATALVPVGISPVHYSVQAKDIAGNTAYTLDGTVV